MQTSRADDHIQFLARLGAAMAAANYPVTLIREMLRRASSAYGVSTEFVALPNTVQVVGPATASGTAVKSASVEADLRFDQTFPLARLVSAARKGAVDPAAGEAELERIRSTRHRLPAWVTVIGYGIWSAGLALVLEPTPLNLLGATVFGLMVGAIAAVGRGLPLLNQLVPVISAFVVTALSILAAHRLGLDHIGLRALIPPLAMFLPGAALTLAVIELNSRDTISGASRLVAGFVQLAQLAFGIFIAVQVLGEAESQLSSVAVNKLGSWAPWVGVAVYAFGLMLFLGPPLRFLPWLVVVCYAAYSAQYLGDLLFGSYVSGFTGGVVLTVCALAMASRAGAPPAISLILPGFWLLVPGSMGLIGIAELFGADGDSAIVVTFISMFSVAFGLQTGLVCWQLVRRARRPRRHPGLSSMRPVE
ncbi:threonine/serine exporter ThrE family protein [Mycobacterium sp. SMC-4]|uniref:threonine/serine ThrE exporter family protein n=1 Tax=Mycobacterium sp. SMC-4 TaxID=2857059 RepID=UPI0021B3526C|nr:threonine/serine exporter family protein [Mycobacterium sp. SMC-4]UXA20369.1 threonine/serine exporter family protein [Mycobacterium sp. SMC-4]